MHQRSFLTFGSLLLFAAFMLIPEAVFAIDERTTEVGQVLTYGDFISTVWAWATRAVFAIAVIGIVVGALLFSASSGDEEKADIGRQTIRGSVIAIFITLLSAVLNRFIQSPAHQTEQVQDLGSLVNALEGAAKGFVAVVAAVSAAALVASSIRLITASADQLKIEKGKNGIKYSILGLIIALSAWGILSFVINIWR